MDREQQIEKLIASCDFNLANARKGDSGNAKEGFDLASATALGAMETAELLTQTAKQMFILVGSLPGYLSGTMANDAKELQLFSDTTEALKNISVSIELTGKHLNRVGAAQSSPSDPVGLLVDKIREILGLMTKAIEKTDHLMDILPKSSDDSAAGVGAEAEGSGLAEEALNALDQLTGMVGTVAKQIGQIPLAVLEVSTQQLASMAQEIKRSAGAFTSTESEEHEH